MTDIELSAAADSVDFIKLPVSYKDNQTKGIGLVVPFDFALDDECWRWMPQGHPLYISRTEFSQYSVVDERLAQDVSDARVVVPAIHSLVMAKPESIGYACTMGSFIGGNTGELSLRETMSGAGAKNPVTTSGALVEALRELGINKVSIATPYSEELTRQLSLFLAEAGVGVKKAGYLGSEGNIMNIGYETVREMADAIDDKEAEALFFSCTNLRTFDIITDLEQALGKPVLSANMVTMWSTLRNAKLPFPEVNHRLFMQTGTTTN